QPNFIMVHILTYYKLVKLVQPISDRYYFQYPVNTRGWGKGNHRENRENRWCKGNHGENRENRWYKGNHRENRWCKGNHGENRWCKRNHGENRHLQFLRGNDIICLKENRWCKGNHWENHHSAFDICLLGLVVEKKRYYMFEVVWYEGNHRENQWCKGNHGENRWCKGNHGENRHLQFSLLGL
ncbi:hypothetical protein ACJX0J_041610, partial [Zea mays]